MKKIYSNIKTLAALLVAGAAFTACSSSDSENIIEQPENPSAKTYKLTVQATLESDQASTRGMAEEEGTKRLILEWENTDKVKMFNNENDAYCGQLFATSVYGNNAQLLGEDIKGNFNYNEKGTRLEFGSPNYTGQEGTLDYIYHYCNYAIALVTLWDAPHEYFSLKSTPAYFENQQAIIKLTLKNGSTPISANSVSFKKGESEFASFYNATAKDVIYLAIPECNTNELNINVDGTYNKHLTVNNKLEKGKFYTMTVTF